MQKITAWLFQHAALLVIALGLAFVCIGIMRGEQNTVLQKAIMICLECIGLG